MVMSSHAFPRFRVLRNVRAPWTLPRDRQVQTVFRRPRGECGNANGDAPAGTPPSLACDWSRGYGQVTSISNGLFTGDIGLAMSIPVALPLIL